MKKSFNFNINLDWPIAVIFALPLLGVQVDHAYLILESVLLLITFLVIGLAIFLMLKNYKKITVKVFALKKRLAKIVVPVLVIISLLYQYATLGYGWLLYGAIALLLGSIALHAIALKKYLETKE